LAITAAMTGLLAGAIVNTGCKASDESGMSASSTASDKHDCKGQNSCKGKGGCKTSGTALAF